MAIVDEQIWKLEAGLRASCVRRRLAAGVVMFLLAAAGSGCGSEPKLSLTVGARPVGEFPLIGEIVAQMLERRLGAEVTRSFDLGSTPLAYQSIVMQHVDIVPENVNAILTTVLKENIDPDPVIALERVKVEMDRLARARVLEPLGIRQSFAMVVPRQLAAERKVKTIGEAARSGAWMTAHTSEFPDRADGYNALAAKYGIRHEVAPQIMTAGEAYERLKGGSIEMFAGYNTDGQLEEPDFVELQDDLGAFRPGNTCLLVRRDVISRHEVLKALLDQLSGRFDTGRIRKLNYEVAVKKRTLAEVAREALAGMKLE